MANKKFSQFETATNITGLEVVGTQDGNNVKIDGALLGGGESYSTTETLTGGTWINGKPIYRKVLTATSIDGEMINFLDCSALDIELLKSLTGFATNGYDRYELNGNFNNTTAGDDFMLNTCSGWYSDEDNGIAFNYSACNFTDSIVTRPAFNFTFIIEYTKTTD